MTDRTVTWRRRPGRVVGTAIVLLLGVASIGVLAAQVEVTDAAVGATRGCGSALDGVIDRSGWETWWAGDLAEPDDEVRSALVRTTGCPDAVNTRIVIGAALALAAALTALTVWARRPHDVGRPTAPAGGARARLARLGRVTTVAGTALTVAGVLAVVLLVADADSTLFLYTDRFVVAVVGLIVLVPTIALVVIGRAVAILATPDADDGDRPGDDDDRDSADAT